MSEVVVQSEAGLGCVHKLTIYPVCTRVCNEPISVLIAGFLLFSMVLPGLSC